MLAFFLLMSVEGVWWSYLWERSKGLAKEITEEEDMECHYLTVVSEEAQVPARDIYCSGTRVAIFSEKNYSAEHGTDGNVEIPSVLWNGIRKNSGQSQFEEDKKAGNFVSKNFL